MLSNYKKSKQEGFTIIEVMIVLAIAGLILLIVFLAVPSLQRNSRNTQRKTDAASVSAGVATFLSNNNGKLPALLGNNTDTSLLDLCSSANGGAANGGGTACTANTNYETAKLGYYEPTSVRITAVATAAAGFTKPTVAATGTAIADNSITSDQVLIVPKASCKARTATSYSYSPRGAIVLYVTEATTGNGSLQCVE